MTEYYSKILTKEEFEKGLNDITDKLSETSETSTYKNVYKDMIKDGLGDLIDRVISSTDNKPVIYSNPNFDRLICEDVKSALGIVSIVFEIDDRLAIIKYDILVL